MVPNFFKRQQGKDRSEVVSGSSEGYDAPEADPANDHLGRQRVAATIYRLLVDTPQDWSTRVGLFGAWGEGKTTVCRFVERLARSDNHILLWFNPWAARSIGELWGNFSIALIDALSRAGIEIQGTAFAIIANRFRKVLGPVRDIAEFDSRAKAIVNAGAFGLDMLKGDRKLVAHIRSHIIDRRIIVIIDDLDRVKPELIPTLLLSLRELLDVPQFSFLLPFDAHIVSQALMVEHPAWGTGERFIEKIIDFRYQLPKPTPAQCQRLFRAGISNYCNFVPIANINTTLSLLPDNPRRVKLLVRSLAMLKGEVARHGESELDWSLIMFAALVRLESEAYLDAYVESIFGERDIDSGNLWIRFLIKPREATAEHQKHIEAILTAVRIDDSDTKARLTMICQWASNHISTRTSEEVRYHCELLTRPHAVTWHEFDELITIADCDVAKASRWITDHAAKQSIDTESVAREVSQTCVRFYENALESAKDRTSLVDHDLKIALAKRVLEFLRNLIRGELFPTEINYTLVSSTLFKSFLEVTVRWAHFIGNETDRSARMSEKLLLRDWLNTIAQDQLIPVTNEIAEFRHAPFQHQSKELKSWLLTTSKERLSQLVLEKLGESDIRELFRGLVIPSLILDDSSPIWAPDGGRVKTVLSLAGASEIVRSNALTWLDCVRSAKSGEIGNVAPTLESFIGASFTIAPLWAAAVAVPLQFIMLKHVRELRKELIAAGVADEALPIPDWLHEQPASS